MNSLLEELDLGLLLTSVTLLLGICTRVGAGRWHGHDVLLAPCRVHEEQDVSGHSKKKPDALAGFQWEGCTRT